MSFILLLFLYKNLKSCHILYMSLRRLNVTITTLFDEENKSQYIFSEILFIDFNYLHVYGFHLSLIVIKTKQNKTKRVRKRWILHGHCHCHCLPMASSEYCWLRKPRKMIGWFDIISDPFLDLLF